MTLTARAFLPKAASDCLSYMRRGTLVKIVEGLISMKLTLVMTGDFEIVEFSRLLDADRDSP